MGIPKKGLLAIGIAVALLSGCAGGDPPPAPEASPRRTLRIGLIPEQNIFRQIERYQPLAQYLSRKLGIGISLKILPRYGNIIESFRSSGLDGAFFGSFTYALAHSKLGVSVLARPVNPDGSSTYHGLLFVRENSGIRRAGDMRNKRFVFVDRATTAGYLLPLEYFHESGIEDYRRFLGETYFSGTHEDAIYDVLEGRADVGAAKNTVFDRLALEDPRLDRELLVLMRSPKVPENGLALREGLEDSLRSRMKEVLLAMHEDSDGREALRQLGALRFIATTDEDYAPVFTYAREVGLDLSTYDYMND